MKLKPYYSSATLFFIGVYSQALFLIFKSNRLFTNNSIHNTSLKINFMDLDPQNNLIIVSQSGKIDRPAGEVQDLIKMILAILKPINNRIKNLKDIICVDTYKLSNGICLLNKQCRTKTSLIIKIDRI